MTCRTRRRASLYFGPESNSVFVVRVSELREERVVVVCVDEGGLQLRHLGCEGCAETPEERLLGMRDGRLRAMGNEEESRSELLFGQCLDEVERSNASRSCSALRRVSSVREVVSELARRWTIFLGGVGSSARSFLNPSGSRMSTPKCESPIFEVASAGLTENTFCPVCSSFARSESLPRSSQGPCSSLSVALGTLRHSVSNDRSVQLVDGLSDGFDGEAFHLKKNPPIFAE